MEFGAFVNFFGPRTAWCTSRSSPTAGRRPSPTWSRKATQVWVKLLGFDDRGKVRLSMKVVDQATGKELEKAEAAS